MALSRVTTRKIGPSSQRFTDLDETVQDIKTSETNLYGFNIINSTSSAAYVKLFNAPAAEVTLGTTVPVKTIYVEANGSAVMGVDEIPLLHCDTALSVACVTELVDSGTTGPATDLIADFSYA